MKKYIILWATITIMWMLVPIVPNPYKISLGIGGVMGTVLFAIFLFRLHE